MNRHDRLAAIVVGHTDTGESDRIVRLLTAQRGRISAMARGARRSHRRFGGALDLGNRLDLQLRRGRGELPMLVSAELVHGHPEIRRDLARMAQAAYACELCAMLAREHRPEPRLFGLLEIALLVLDTATAPPGVVFRWGLEAKALTFGGLGPSLERCAACGGEMKGDALYSPAAGGAVHPRCGSGEPCSRAWRAQVEGARRTPLAELVDGAPLPGPRRALLRHLAWHAGREPRSWKLLSGLEAG